MRQSIILLFSYSRYHWRKYFATEKVTHNEKELIFHHSNFQTPYPYLIYLYYISTCIIIIFHFPLGLSNFQLYLLTCPPYQPVSTHRNDNEKTKARDHDTIKNVQRAEQEEERKGGQGCTCAPFRGVRRVVSLGENERRGFAISRHPSCNASLRPLLSSSSIVSPFLSPLHARCTLIGKHRPATLIAIGRRFLQITTLVRRRANQPSRDPRYRVR